MNFGIVDTTTTGNITTSANLDIQCQGQPGANLFFCAYIGAVVSDRYMTYAGTNMPFQIYQNAAMSKLWKPRSWRPPTPMGVSLTLNAQGQASTSVTAYGLLSNYAGKPAGPYMAISRFTLAKPIMRLLVAK